MLRGFLRFLNIIISNLLDAVIPRLDSSQQQLNLSLPGIQILDLFAHDLIHVMELQFRNGLDKSNLVVKRYGDTTLSAVVPRLNQLSKQLL